MIIFQLLSKGKTVIDLAKNILNKVQGFASPLTAGYTTY